MNNESELAKNRENFWKNISNSYYKCNTINAVSRRRWFSKIVLFYHPKSVLEIGCNEGANLREIHKLNPEIKLSGIDINLDAANYARLTLPNANIVCGSIYDLDKYFKEKEFDLIFSMGVLIHIPPEMMENIRNKTIYLARNIILHCEEHSANPEIKRRGEGGVGHRWSHDYGSLYKNYKIKIYKNIFGSGKGAYHLMVINLAKDMNNLMPIWKKFYFWYLSFLLPLISKYLNIVRAYSKIIKVRLKGRNVLFF